MAVCGQLGPMPDHKGSPAFRSTKGASKARRDMINNEICNLRDMLPLPESARQRLSQLQIMSLACCFIRKSNYFGRMFGGQAPGSDVPFEFSQSMTGFLLIITREGKLLYISENVTEYLGHSMVDMMTQGDSIYDIIDKKDHQTVQSQLLHNNMSGGATDERSFFCRMNVSRAFRRQSGIGEHKVMHVHGLFLQPTVTDQYTSQAMFMALCTPLITPDLKESIIQNHTMVFTTVHGLDMKFIEISQNGEFHLGYQESHLAGKSWYEFLHPEDIHEAKDKHLQLIKSSHEMGCMLTMRMMTSFGQWVWVNVVMHVRQPYLSENADPAIVCINQVIDSHDAKSYRLQSQLYSSHIARSPEFLPSGGNSPITISQVPLDREHGYPYAEMHGSMDTTIYGEFGLSIAPVTSMARTTADVPLPYTTTDSAGNTYHNLACSPGVHVLQEENGRKSLRAEVINRLKRKVTDITEDNQQICKPNKIPRFIHDFGNDSNGGLIVRSSQIADSSLFTSIGQGYGSGGGDGIAVLPSVINDVIAEPLSLKSKVADLPDLQRLPTMVASQSVPDLTLPPTPLTPGSIKSEPDTTTRLTIDTSETIVPASYPSPEASPVQPMSQDYEAASPAQAVSCELPTAIPTMDADSVSLFSSEAELKPRMEVKPNMASLPVLDLTSVQEYFTALEVPGAPSGAGSSVARPDTCQSPKSPTSDEIVQMSYDQLSAFLGQVANAVIDCVNSEQQQERPPSTGSHVTHCGIPVPPPAADLTGEFMVVPEVKQEDQHPTAPSQANLALECDLLDLQMDSEPSHPSHGGLLDELYRLNFDMPSHGSGDQTNPLC